MGFQIVRNDIVNMSVDAIVNTANPKPVIGSGTDTGIHAKAGPGLLEARKQIGDIRPGTAAATPAFGLDAKYVIHTAGPVWRGGLLGEEKTLRSCYSQSLKLARELGCRSIAFPLISAGNYGFPKDRALRIATQVFSEFLAEQEMDIYLVVFNQEVFHLSETLFRDVASYIDRNYVAAVEQFEYGSFRQDNRLRPREDTQVLPAAEAPMEYPAEREVRPASARRPLPPRPAQKLPLSLGELLERTDAGFSETLLQLIDRSGKKDSEIYTRANVSRQHFSKIRNNPGYKPTKPTAIAFAIALELDLEQTRDLIGRAGYALTRSSKFDVIIMYFIEKGNYNFYDINSALYEFDQSLLGA